jgi:hypothetical protein
MNRSSFVARFFQPLNTNRVAAQRGAIGGIPEQVIAIAVGVLVVSGMIALGSKAFEGSNTSAAMADMNQIINKTRDLYSGVRGFGPQNRANAQLLPVLVDASVFPTKLVVTRNDVRHQWDNAIQVAINNTYFDLTYQNLPQSVCIDLMTKTPSENIVQVTGSGGPITTFPIDAVTAQANCADPQSVTWRFKG